MRLLYAQVTVPPPEDVREGAGGLNTTVMAIAGGVLALLVFVLLLRRVLFKKAPAKIAAPPTQVALPEQSVAPRVELAPSQLEAQKRAEAESAREQADEARAKRERLATEAKSADATTRGELEAQARALKEAEEEAKRAAYRAEKAAEAEEKERHKRERAEGERLAAEAVQQAKDDAARIAAEAAAAEKVRISAQSGQTLAMGLTRTRNEGFIGKLNGLFGGGTPRVIDEKVLGELEEVLFTADIGVRTASSLVELARDTAKKNDLQSADKLKDVIRKEVARIVDLKAPHSLSGGGPPHVVMVVGVNGSGKTTTTGKLAAKARAEGKVVVLAAGDTFRAAAAEQLDVWAERSGSILVKGKDDADPASVIFDGVRKGIELKADLVIADTAGRLHTKVSLMEELKKVRRVIDKALPGAPHEVLLVLDSTNGQNAIAQAKQFNEAVGITSIALTKLDGTAKGGVIIGICDELKVPVSWAGVGEKVEDLKAFDPKEFVAALFD